MKRGQKELSGSVIFFIDNIHFYEKEKDRWTSNFNSTQHLMAIQISSVKTAHSLENLVLGCKDQVFSKWYKEGKRLRVCVQVFRSTL